MIEQSDREKLIIEALNEIAEQMGNSFYHPISLGLLCLNLGISNDDKEKIFVQLHKVLQENDFDSLNFQLFKDAISQVYPQSEEFSDLVISALLKAYAKNMIPELFPFTEYLDD